MVSGFPSFAGAKHHQTLVEESEALCLKKSSAYGNEVSCGLLVTTPSVHIPAPPACEPLCLQLPAQPRGALHASQAHTSGPPEPRRRSRSMPGLTVTSPWHRHTITVCRAPFRASRTRPLTPWVPVEQGGSPAALLQKRTLGMELRPHHPRAPQPSPSPRRSTSRRRARARPDQGPSPPKRQRMAKEEGCGLCKRADRDPVTFGETCRQDTLCIHENCLYHASGLIQRGDDDEGFFGFLLPDIEQELQRVAQKMCCICRQRGASVRCQRRRCSRTFHYPCGRERGCVSQFFGRYRSFCWLHRPRQRARPARRVQPHCVICLEAVEEQPSYSTVFCPACTGSQFHRDCIQLLALSALHFRCPLCRDSENFQAEMLRLGIKVPNRTEVWEEVEAFQDLFQQQSSCDAGVCHCPLGREHSDRLGPWRMLLCSSCGSHRTHHFCSSIAEDIDSWDCDICSGAGNAPSGSAPGQ